MLTREQFGRAQERAAAMLTKAKIALTPEEREHLEVADFGLGDLERTVVVVDGMLKEREAAQPKAASS